MSDVLMTDKLLLRLEAEVKRRGDELAAFGSLPHLAIVVVGEDPAIRARARARVKYGTELGMAVEVHEFPTMTSSSSLMKVIRRLSGDAEVDGVLVETPLPEHLADLSVEEELNWEKDVSGHHPANLGKILTGQEKSALLPVHIQACMLLLEQEKLSDRRVTILCSNNETGHALVPLLHRRGAVVTVYPPDYPDLRSACLSADILITAINRTGTIDPQIISPDTWVIDLGQTLQEHADLVGKAKVYISLHVGLERLLSALLFRNLVTAAEKVRETTYAR